MSTLTFAGCPAYNFEDMYANAQIRLLTFALVFSDIGAVDLSRCVCIIFHYVDNLLVFPNVTFVMEGLKTSTAFQYLSDSSSDRPNLR